MNKKQTWIIIVIAIILIAGVWYFQKPEPASGEAVKVGVISPITGDAAIYGEVNVNIIKIAAEEINKNGGVDGRPIELVVEDGKCNGQDAASAAHKLINVHKVQVIIGGFCSSESLAIIPIAEKAKIALLSPGSSSPDLTGVSKFFTRNYPSDDTQGKVLAQAAIDRGYKKVAFIQEQTDYALGIFNAFSEEFEKQGGEIIKEEFISATSDFRSSISKLESQNPDALFISVQTPASGLRLVKQISETDWRPNMLVSDVLADAQVLSEGSDIFEGALAAQFGLDEGNSRFSTLSRLYKEKYEVDVLYPTYAQTEYDALFLVRDAIEEVGYDGGKIAGWFHQVKDWSGASGKVTIKSDGDRDGGHVLKIVKDGKIIDAK